MDTLEAQFKLYLDFIYADMVIGVSLTAIQLFMCASMTSMYLELPAQTKKGRIPYLCVSFMLLAFTAASSIIHTSLTHDIFFHVSPGSENVLAGLQLISEMPNTEVVGLLADISIRIADALLVYRCYLVWYDQKWVGFLVGCLYIAGLAVGIRSYVPLSYWNPTINAVDITLAVALNVAVTLIISLRLVIAHRRSRAIIASHRGPGYLGIVAILTESAALLAIFGIGAAITTPLEQGGFSSKQAGVVFQIIYHFVAILAPQMIISRVAAGRSWATVRERTTVISREIEFAEKIQSADKETLGSPTTLP
ncbi:hypothetical protein BKA70DRAFT_1562595 [Coprinopsis sp. MPI-PUGE-AT-0042]|nr:hypothetical protein BKA70DRAFT_1562595 [Coprinopsis sp. MPI-PUGE-AT-0042]